MPLKKVMLGLPSGGYIFACWEKKTYDVFLFHGVWNENRVLFMLGKSLPLKPLEPAFHISKGILLNINF